MDDYRGSHASEEQAAAYERLFRPGTYESWIWEHERACLESIIDSRFDSSPARALDFACGTGRVLEFLESRVDSVTGIDVSEQMLSVARTKVSRAELVHGDLTTDPALVHGPFDLITAFRFFLNAQQSLRDAVLSRLSGLLSPNGILVFNVHGNRRSLRAPIVMLKRYALRRADVQLSRASVERMLRAHALRIDDTYGFGMLPRPLHRGSGARLNVRAQSLADPRPWLQRFAVDQLYVARRR